MDTTQGNSLARKLSCDGNKYTQPGVSDHFVALPTILRLRDRTLSEI
jgi:hypothetical protein